MYRQSKVRHLAFTPTMKQTENFVFWVKKGYIANRSKRQTGKRKIFVVKISRELIWAPDDN